MVHHVSFAANIHTCVGIKRENGLVLRNPIVQPMVIDKISPQHTEVEFMQPVTIVAMEIWTSKICVQLIFNQTNSVIAKFRFQTNTEEVEALIFSEIFCPKSEHPMDSLNSSPSPSKLIKNKADCLKVA